MTAFEWITIGIIALLFVISFVYYTKRNKRLPKFLFGAGSGVALLFPACWVLSALGMAFSINIFTVSISVVLGIPGVILLSALSFF